MTALNSKFVFAVLNPPADEKKGTTLDTCPAAPAAPVAAIAIEPVPSELIVAPPRLIVSPAKNISLNLLEELPRLLVQLPSGIIS